MFVGAVSPPTCHLQLGPTTDMWTAITISAVLNGQRNCLPPKAALWPWQHSRPICASLGFQPWEQRCSLPLSCLRFIIFSGGASGKTGWGTIKQGEQSGRRGQWIRNSSKVRGGEGVLVLNKLYFQIILLSTLRSKPNLNERCEPIKPVFKPIFKTPVRR